MRKLFYPLIFSVLHSAALLATGDSLNYLTPKDTVFIKLDDFGSKFFQHRLERGQTLFSLARFYGLKLESLYSFNASLAPDSPVPPGQVVRVPIPDSAIVRSWERGMSARHFAPVFYAVRHGDTFYRIARHYFNQPLDTLQNRNQLASTVMKSGQLLHVGWLSLDGITDSLQLASANPLQLKMLRLQESFERKKGSQKPLFQNGAAYWQREKKGDADDFYALHREAPVGSVLQVKNTMKGKVVYAKVIAKIPDRAYGDDTIVVLSPSLAKMLGAKDPRFFVEVRYFAD